MGSNTNVENLKGPRSSDSRHHHKKAEDQNEILTLRL